MIIEERSIAVVISSNRAFHCQPFRSTTRAAPGRNVGNDVTGCGTVRESTAFLLYT